MSQTGSFYRLFLCLLACLVAFSATAAYAQVCPRLQSLPQAHNGSMGYNPNDTNLYMCDGIAWRSLGRAGATGTTGGGGTTTTPTTPTPTCYKGLIYRLGFGCCVEIAANLALLELVLGIKLKLCPAI